MADAAMESVADPLAALNVKPKKGILKNSSSFDKPAGPTPCGAKETKWDEMNILATHHPADKDYGHMKVEEPKTPYSYYNELDEEMEAEGTEQASIDPAALASQIGEAAGCPPKVMREDDDAGEEEIENETEEEKANRIAFEARRKAHYKEFYAVQLARKLMERDELEAEETADAGAAHPETESMNQ